MYASPLVARTTMLWFSELTEIALCSRCLQMWLSNCKALDHFVEMRLYDMQKCIVCSTVLRNTNVEHVDVCSLLFRRV